MNATEKTSQPLNIGFIGLGDMGAPMANNLATRYSGNNLQLSVFDIKLHTDRIPVGAIAVDSLTDLAASSEIIFMSVPDGASSKAVVDGLLATQTSKLRCLINQAPQFRCLRGE